MWATTGGAAIAGDDSLQSALREAKEELGVDLNPQSGRLLFRLKKHSEFPHFDDIWLFKADIELSKLIFQPDEVSDAKWTTKEMILEMIDKKEFVNVYTYLGDLFKISLPN